MPKLIDLTGKRFGRLVVLQLAGANKRRQSLWSCECDCGKIITTLGHSLKSRNTRSCGCLNMARITKHSNAIRGDLSITYQSWMDMNQRCNNHHSKVYKNYGNRRITICERWQKFANFLKDMGARPDKNYSIDRIDNNGHYNKANCRWATRKQQQRNRRNNHLITHNGRTQCIASWSEETKISCGVILWRIIHNWSVKRALTEPVQKRRKK